MKFRAVRSAIPNSASIHRAQADLLDAEASAKRWLADEYDAAQDRGEIRQPNTGRSTSALEAPSAADIGLSHKDIYEAPQIRDGEASPSKGRAVFGGVGARLLTGDIPSDGVYLFRAGTGGPNTRCRVWYCSESARCLTLAVAQTRVGRRKPWTTMQ